jgi:hypothetical protein
MKSDLQRMIEENPGKFIGTIKTVTIRSLMDSFDDCPEIGVASVLIACVDPVKFSKIVSEMPKHVFHLFHEAIEIMSMKDIIRDLKNSGDENDCDSCEHREECLNSDANPDQPAEEFLNFGIKINPKGGESK